MKIKFLKAGSGDSILIQYEKHNVLIDGGNDTTYVKKELQLILQKDEKIDLLVITHHDDDHIAGIISILKDVADEKYGRKKDFIKRVIFNSPRLIKNLIGGLEDNIGELSYKQADETERLLLKIDTEWKDKGITIAGEKINIGNVELTILAPQKEVLDNYSEEKRGALLSGGKKCDWSTKLKALERWVDDNNLDTNIANSSSVVIQIKFENENILLSGDVTPKEFSRLLNKLYVENGNSPVHFDYLKLPHHGSHRNISDEVLSRIDCHNFIITTNGGFKLPDKKAFLKILKSINRDSRKTVNFYFNYGELIPNLCISNEELKEYNFKLIVNNQEYGYCI